MNLARFTALPEVIHVYAFPRWKWPVVRQCFAACKVVFIDKKDTLPSNGWLVLWGMAPVPAGLSSHVQVMRMEDGFLRSVGLGADLVRPLSWVLDSKGIYYDATQPSDLEGILANSTFDEALLARAAHLRTRIIAAGLTKYNTGSIIWQRPNTKKRMILVPGQVESDASIAYGAQHIKSNMGLLRAVRESNPDAYVVYKPHPDVLARLRREGEGEKEAYRWCDEVVADAAMGDMLNLVDEIHVLTSLAGFEALLRAKPVTCYGQPFYSGWGLTADVVAVSRRKRVLSIDELVAGVLILYPLYLSRDGKRLITPEEALDMLLAWRNRAGDNNPWWRGIVRVFLRYFIGVR